VVTSQLQVERRTEDRESSPVENQPSTTVPRNKPGRDITTSTDVKITYFREMKECLFQKIFGASDVLGDSVSGVVTATESCPFLGTQTSSVVASTWVCTCTSPGAHVTEWKTVNCARKKTTHRNSLPDMLADRFYRAMSYVARITMPSQDVRLSVRPSVTHRNSIETTKHINKLFHHRIATPF